jgi:hypothetical protein
MPGLRMAPAVDPRHIRPPADSVVDVAVAHDPRRYNLISLDRLDRLPIDVAQCDVQRQQV